MVVLSLLIKANQWQTLLSRWHTVAQQRASNIIEGWLQSKTISERIVIRAWEKKERNQYLEVVEHPTPTPSCVTAKPIALRDKMLSNVTIDCFLR